MGLVNKGVSAVINHGQDAEVDFLYSLIIIEKDPNNEKDSIIKTIYCEDSKVNLPAQILQKAVIKSMSEHLPRLSEVARKYIIKNEVKDKAQ